MLSTSVLKLHEGITYAASHFLENEESRGYLEQSTRYSGEEEFTAECAETLQGAMRKLLLVEEVFEFVTGVDVEFLIDAVKVVADRSPGDGEPRGDFSIGHTGGSEPGDLLFAQGKRIQGDGSIVRDEPRPSTEKSTRLKLSSGSGLSSPGSARSAVGTREMPKQSNDIGESAKGEGGEEKEGNPEPVGNGHRQQTKL